MSNVENNPNNDATVYYYSNDNIGPNNNENQNNAVLRAQAQPRGQGPMMTREQIVALVSSLNYDMLREYLDRITREGQREQLAAFGSINPVFLVVKKIIQQYKTSPDILNEQIQGGLNILKLLRGDPFQMNVYEGEGPGSKVRPGNLAAAADSAIGIPILEILMEGHSDPRAIGNMSILQPDGFYRVGERGEIILPKDERAPIFDAIEKNQFETVKYLVKEGSRINAILEPKSGDSPLSYAILQAINQEIATFLFEKRANVNFVDRYGEPLLQSIIRNQFNWEGKANINTKRKSEIRLAFVDLIANSPYYSPKPDNQGRSAVVVATLQGCPLILDILLKVRSIRENLRGSLAQPFLAALLKSSYISPEKVANADGKKAKMDSIIKYFLRKVDYEVPEQSQLVENGFIIPIIESAIMKDAELLRLLLARFLLISGYYRNQIFTRTLLQGNTNPITYAILKNRLESLQILAENPQFPTVVNSPDSAGRVPLLEAMEKENMELIKFLLAKGANASQGTQNQTPLIRAIQKGFVDLITLFLENGADINKETLITTPLLAAIQSGSLDIVTLLLERGANPNKESATETPLLAAVQTKSVDLVNLLLERGADPNKSNRIGMFPLLLAMDLKDQPIIDLLRAKGAKADALLFKASLSGTLEVVKQLLADGLSPTIETTINGKQFNAYDICPNMEVRLLFAPYFEQDQPKFRGFTPADFELFDEFWNIDEKFENTCICPICFTLNVRGVGCFYQTHNCEQLANGNYTVDKQKEAQGGPPAKKRHVHAKLYQHFLTTDLSNKAAIQWCLKCNRICFDRSHGGHVHYDVAPPILQKKPSSVVAGDPYGATSEEYCYDSRGGNTIEKLWRLQKLLEFMCRLNQEFAGKISLNMAYNLTKEYFMDSAMPGKNFFECGNTPGIFTTKALDGRTIRSPINRDIVILHTLLKEYEEFNKNFQVLRDLKEVEVGDIKYIDLETIQNLIDFATLVKKKISSMPKEGITQEMANIHRIVLAVFELLTPLKDFLKKLGEDKQKLRQKELGLESEYSKLMKEFGFEVKRIAPKNNWLQELEELELFGTESQGLVRENAAKVSKIQTNLLDRIQALRDEVEALNAKGDTDKQALIQTFIQQLREKAQADALAAFEESIEIDPKKFEYEEQYESLLKTIQMDPDVLELILGTTGKIMKEKKFIFPDDCFITVSEGVAEEVLEKTRNNEPNVQNTLAGSLKPVKTVKYEEDGLGEGDQHSCDDPNEIKGDFMCTVHYDNHDDHRDLYKFCHKQKDGSYYNHTDDYACRYGIIEHIKSVLFDEQTGMVCYNRQKCKGVLHPNEIKAFFFDDVSLDPPFKEYIEGIEAKIAGDRFEAAEQRAEEEFAEVLALWQALPAEDKVGQEEPQHPPPPKRADFPPKVIQWGTEGPAVKERAQKELRTLWGMYEAKYKGWLKDQAKKAQKGGANVQYSFFAVEKSREMVPGCPLKKRVKGGYRKTRKTKKVLKTRKAKRYTKTRKH
jgi:ankyrin repeat protein